MKLTLLILAVMTVGCALGTHGKKTDTDIVLVETSTGEPRETAQNPELSDLISKDATAAAEILNRATHLKDSEIAAWAAIYLLRLGVKHDFEATFAAITHGVNSDDPLLAALCWRWIATNKNAKLPDWKNRNDNAPVVKLFAALAHKVVGKKLPKDLKQATALPDKPVNGKHVSPTSREQKLTMLSMPYDNGPLSNAITFVEARRTHWIQSNTAEKPAWAAKALRAKLYATFELSNDDSKESIEDANRSNEPERLTERLNLPLCSQPQSILRSAAVTGKGSLKIDALRCLAVVALSPLAGDLGAAAAAMNDDEIRIRIEAARTYLLLTARSIE